MSNALHDYAKLFEKYAANNGGTGAILTGEDCLAIANEMRMDADDIDAENAKLREEIEAAKHDLQVFSMSSVQLDAENAKLREHIASFIELSQDMVIYAGQNMKRHFTKRLRKLGVPL